MAHSIEAGSILLRQGAQIAVNQVNRFQFQPPVQGGVNSYGRVIGVIASIAIAILCIVVPLYYAFHAIYSKIQTNRKALENIRMNLAEKRLQALEKVTPSVKFTNHDFRIGACERSELIKLGYSPARIETDLEALFQGRDQKDCPEPLIRLYKKEKKLQGLLLKQGEIFDANLKKIQISEKDLIALAKKGQHTRHLQAFLLKKGSFGTDPNSQEFKAGMEAVKQVISYLDFEAKAFEVNLIIDAIKKAPRENLEQYLQVEVRERLDRLQKSLAYQVLLEVEGREHPVVCFVQDLSLALRLDSHGMDQLHHLGQKYVTLVKKERELREEESPVSYLAVALDKTIGKYHWSYKIESFFDKLLVYRSYPEKTAMAVLSHQPDRALDYNSYQVGNFDMASGNFCLGEDRIRAIHGPTPTSDQLLIAQLEAQREFGGIHLQHNLEHPGFSKGDNVRIQYLLEVEKAFPDTFRLMSTPLDGAAMGLTGKSGEYFKTYTSVQEFYLKYGTYAFTGQMKNPERNFSALQGEAHRKVEGKGDNGFYLGKDVMTDEQFRLAFECAADAFSHINPQEIGERERLTRAMQVGVQGFIAMGGVVKTLQDAYKNPSEAEEALLRASFGQACKLDIDRGVILNVMTRVYFQLAAGKTLTEDDIAEIIGTVIGRAELVSGRTIIFDRYQPLSDTLYLIGSNEGNVQQALQRYLQEGFGVDANTLHYQSTYS